MTNVTLERVEERHMKKRILVSSLILLWLTFASSFVSDAKAQTQTVYFSSDELTVLLGESVTVDLMYSVSGAGSGTTGLGLRLHYNSREISALILKDAYRDGLLAVDKTAQNDESDFDHDPSTDKYISVAWMNIRGDWPKGASLPTKLGRVYLTISPDCNASMTGVNTSASDNAVGYDFSDATISLRIIR